MTQYLQQQRIDMVGQLKLMRDTLLHDNRTREAAVLSRAIIEMVKVHEALNVSRPR